jgi:hypothetical protein
MRFTARWAVAGLIGALLVVAQPAPSIAGRFDGVTVRLGTFGGKWRDIV